MNDSNCANPSSNISCGDHIYPFGHQLNQLFTIGISVYFIIITLAGILFNLLLILIIIFKNKLHSVTNMFVVNLAIGGLLAAIFVVPFDIDFLLRGHFPGRPVACAFREVTFMLSLPTSVVSLLLLTLERYISVTFPFKRIRYIKKRNVCIIIPISWCYTFLVAIFPIMYNPNAVKVQNGICWMEFTYEYIYFQLLVNFLLPVIAICFMNVALFIVASRHAADIRKTSLVTSSRSRPSMLTFGANMKAAKTILLLVGVFLVCWLTFIIITWLNIMCNICHSRELTWTSNAINYTSIYLNPLLYGLRNTEIRRELTKIATKLMYNYCSCLRLPLPNEKPLGNSTTLDTLSYADERRGYRTRSTLLGDAMTDTSI